MSDMDNNNNSSSNNNNDDVDSNQSDNNNNGAGGATGATAAGGDVLSSLRYYEELRRTSTTFRLPGQVIDQLLIVEEEVQVQDEPPPIDNDSTNTTTTTTDDDDVSQSQQQQQPQPQEEQEEQEDLAFCHMVGLFPFEDISGVSVAIGYEAAYTVALALQHLNAGDGSVIEEVDGLPNRCPLRFTLGFADTKLDPGVALNDVVSLTDDDQTNNNNENNDNDNDDIRLPSAFLGAFRSAVSGPTSLVSGLRGYPQISGSSTSVQLDDKATYPLFARTIPADDGATESIILYLRDKLQLSHVAVLNANDAFGNSYYSGLLEAASIHAPDMTLIQITIDADVEAANEGSIRNAITTLKDSEFRFVIAILISEAMHDAVMLEAVHQNVAGNGEHNWILSDSSIQVIQQREVSIESDLYKAYSGVGAFKAAAKQGSRYPAFQQQMERLVNPIDVAFVDELIAPAVDNDLGEYMSPSFLKPVQFDFSIFFYEAAISAGLAACAAVTENLTLTGDELYQSLLSLSPFESVSGSMELDAETGTRVPASAYFELVNFQGELSIDSESGERVATFDTITTDLYNQGVWNEVTPFIFSDGTINIPRGIPTIEINQNFISTAMRAVALSMMMVSILAALGFATWTYLHRNSRVVRASQPFFLYLIVVGEVLFTLSIIPLQFDTSITSVDGCSKACTSTVWLLALGFSTVYSALYAKTFRINKIMTSAKACKRIKVTLKATLIPVSVMLSLNTILLILMTLLDRPLYEIFVVQTDRFDQPLETYGTCVWDEALSFLIPLMVINTGIVILALYEAWKARNLATEFAESQYIGRAVVGSAITIGIGGPILFIAQDNPDASLFVSSGVIFVVSILTLCYLFIPKIQFERERQLKMSRRNIVKISGLDGAFSSAAGQISQPNSAAFSVVDAQRPERPTMYATSIPIQNMTNSSHMSRASGASGDSNNGNDEEDESNEFIGERILTTKTQAELVQDLDRLQFKYDQVKRLLQHEREKNKELKAALVDNGVDVGNGGTVDEIPALSPVASSKEHTDKEEITPLCDSSSPNDEISTLDESGPGPTEMIVKNDSVENEEEDEEGHQ